MNRALPVLPTWSPTTHLLILLGATLLLYFIGTPHLPLVDRDEPRFAQATQEMIERGTWLVPYFNGEYRFDKPPLIYWLMRPFYALFGGPHELAARLPGLLCTLATVGLVYFWGRRWFGATTGFAAALGFATCFQTLLHGRLAVADMPMILCVTLAQGALFELLRPLENRPYPWKWFWIFYLAQGLGFLAKGPLVQAISLLTVMIYRGILWRRAQPWGQLKLHLGLPLVLVLIGLWGIPVLVETQGLFWKVGVGKHVVARGMESFDGRPHFLPYYFLTAPLSLFPWFAMVGYACLVFRRHWQEHNAWLCAWFAAPYLIFTIYSTQLPHYVLPGFAGFFLILGQITTLPAQLPRWPQVPYWFFLILYAVISLALAVLAFGSPWVDPFLSLRNALICLWLWFTAGLLLLVAYRQGLCQKIHWLFLLMALGFYGLATSVRSQAPAVAVAEIMEKMPPATTCWARGFSEPSLVFYTGKKWNLDQSMEQIQTALTGDGPRLCVILKEERRLDQVIKWLFRRWSNPVEKMPSRDFSQEIASLSLAGFSQQEVTGLNLARSTWVRVVVLWRP